MNDNINISVAIAVYNGDKYIKDQLISLDNQITKPDEIVIFNDASNDSTIKEIEKFKVKTKIKIVLINSKKNLGYHKAFESAISKCSGNFIFICDSDDVWFDNKIFEIMNIFQKNKKVSLIINDSLYTDENLNPLKFTKIERNLKYYNNTNLFIPGCNTSFKRELLKIYIPFPENYIAYDFWINKISLVLDSRFVYEKVLQYYRRHGKNWSDNNINSFDNSIKNNIKIIFTKLKKNINEDINYSHHLNLLIELKKRLLEQKFVLHNSTQIKKLEKEISAYKKRNYLIRQNRLFRIKIILKLIINNDYQFFNGIKSILKDFIRKKIVFND